MLRDRPDGENNHRVEVLFEQLQVGGVDTYEIERKSVDALPGTPDSDFSVAGNVAAHLVRFIDPDELADGKEYIYRVRGLSTDEFGNSGWSMLVTETAVNEAPVATDDPNYTVRAALTLNVPAPGVLGNDVEDVDSPATSRRLFNVTSGPTNGTLTWNADGSFIYTPNLGFLGVDHFTYVADNGAWSGNPDVPLSPSSAPATVTITVTPNDPTFPPEDGPAHRNRQWADLQERAEPASASEEIVRDRLDDRPAMEVVEFRRRSRRRSGHRQRVHVFHKREDSCRPVACAVRSIAPWQRQLLPVQYIHQNVEFQLDASLHRWRHH